MAPKVCLVIITDGREGNLQKTYDSWMKNLDGKFDYALIVDDSGDMKYLDWLTKTYAGKVNEIVHHTERLGFGRTVADAWAHVPQNCDYIFHLEDDFLLNKELCLNDMVSILESNPSVAQIALYRQPWSSAEIEVGGFFKLRPASFKDAVYIGGGNWYNVVENRSNFTTNPCLYPRKILDIGWPEDPESEGKFGFKLWPLGFICLFLGSIDNEPMVHHFGQRSYNATGY